MLDEDEIIETVSRYLLEKGYAILHTSRPGANIIAREHESDARILISATGFARSSAVTEKLGTSYVESQVFRSVTKGISNALRMSTTDEFRAGDSLALVFPDTPTFRKYLTAEKSIMASFGIKIFLVTEHKDIVRL
jgi:hypothetical protein